MIINRETGDVLFDNLLVNRNLTVKAFLDSAAGQNSTLWMHNGDSETYRFLPATSVSHEFIVLLVFHNCLLNRASISVNHPGSTWDDETPERIESDGEVLRQIMYANFDGQNKNQTFDWGKVEFVRDFKNASDYSIVVTYNP